MYSGTNDDNMVERDIAKALELLENRVSRLEKIISTIITRDDKPKEKLGKSQYKGLTGGINFLIDSGFFKILRSKKEVYDELKKEGYYHRPEAVDTILRRDFVGTKKILSRIEDGKIWKYGLRK